MVKTKLAQKGLNKYTKLSSKAMKDYSKKYKESGKRYSDPRKDEFYEFVARARLRRVKK